MNSTIFSYMGLNIDPAYYIFTILGLVIILFALVIISFSKIKKLNKSYYKFMQGKNAKSLESEVMSLFEDISFLKVSNDKNRQDIKAINSDLISTYQKLGMVRYNAYKEIGGKFSFCIVLLTGENNGFILNSIHSNDGCYIYTKAVKNGECQISLGNEEKKALEKALNNTLETADDMDVE